MKKFYTAKYDRVFKTIICNEDNTIYLKKIIESILKEEVEEIKILKNEIGIGNVSDRLKIVDLLVKIRNKYVHVELNKTYKETIKYRNYIYFSNIISNKTKKGKKYNIEDRFIHIDLTYGMKDESEINKYYIQDDEQKRYIENLQIIEINMDKITKLCYVKEEYKYLGMLDLKPEELIKLAKDDEVVKDYRKELEELNEEEEFQSIMTQEEQAEMMLNTLKYEAREEGLEEGRQEGRKEGIQKGLKEGIQKGIKEGLKEGRKEAINEMVRALYNNKVDINVISKVSDLTQDEIKKIVGI